MRGVCAGRSCGARQLSENRGLTGERLLVRSRRMGSLRWKFKLVRIYCSCLPSAPVSSGYAPLEIRILKKKKTRSTVSQSRTRYTRIKIRWRPRARLIFSPAEINAVLLQPEDTRGIPLLERIHHLG